MKRAYVLAHPAGHSLSPAMHNAAFRQLGIEATYEALDVPPGRLPEVVESLRDEDVYGANVTVPHKLAVMPLLDALDAAAEAIGAVNTVVSEGGRLVGHNTDAAGFLRALLEDAGFSPRAKRVVMLGAGGAARAVSYALLAAGAAELALYNRTLKKAEALAKAFAPFGVIGAVRLEDLEGRVRSADLLVNATSVGMARGEDPDVSPLPEKLLPYRGLVCDIVYRPVKTRLLRDAEAAGLKTQNGLPMLVYQGAEAFRLWTGHDAPIAAMRGAAKRALG